MKSLLMTRALLGVGAALVLVCGCRHCQEQGCSSCATCATSAPGKAMVMTPTPAKPVASSPAPTVQLPVAPVAPLSPSLSIPPVASEKYVAPEKQIVIAQKPPIDETAIPNVTKEEPKEAGSLPDWNKVVVIQRRSFADITARAEFDHDHDYAWLVGSLNYVPQKQQWRLRYTSIDDEDKYGGSVTLDVGPQMMKPYNDGDLVRVSGAVVDPDSREPSPLYRVRSIDLK